MLLAAPVKTLVAPFDNLSPQGTNGWVGVAIAESLTSHLRLAGQDVVPSEERLRGLRQRGLEPGTPPTLAMLMAVGEELGANRVVLGSFRSEGERLEVTIQIVDIPTGDKIGVIDDHGRLEELSGIENQLAKNVLRLEGRQVPEGFSLAADRHAGPPLGAHESFIKAKLSESSADRRGLLESALEVYPGFADAALLLGQVLLEEGEVERAIEMLRTISPEDPAYRETYFTLGIAYLEVNQTALATEIFSRLSEQEKAACFLNNLGVVLLRRGELESAVLAFREAVALEPSAVYVFNLGWAAWRADRPHEARHWLTEATRLDSEDAEAHLLLSALASAEGESETEASRERETALSLSPQLADLDLAAIDGLERIVDRLPAAVANYRFPASAMPVEPPEMTISEIAPTQPIPSEVVREEEEVDSGNPEEQLGKARALRASNDLAGAARELERAIYLDPYSVEIRTELAAVFQEMGELSKAARELQVVLWNREDGPTLLLLAELYEAMGELAKALAHAERAVELDGENEGARQLFERLSASPP